MMDALLDKVVCAQCRVPFSDTPKVLPGCLHVFCLPCLHKLPIAFVLESSPDRPIPKTDSKLSCNRYTSSFTCSLQSPAILTSSSLQEGSQSQESRCRKDSDPLVFSVSCPKCNRYSLLPPTGVDGLQTDYMALSLVGTYTTAKALQSKLSASSCDQCVKDTPAVSFCINCRKMICEDHAKCHNLWEEFSTHRVLQLSSLLYDEENSKSRDSAMIKYLRPSLRLGEFNCPRHFKETNDRHIKYFCTTCADLVCGNCTISSHMVREHHICDCITPELLSEKKKLAKESLDQISNVVQNLDVLSGSIHTQHMDITKNGMEAKRKIEDIFSEVISLLETRKKMLCGEVDDIINVSLGCLADCKKKVIDIKEHAKECQNFVQGNLDCDGDLSLLTVADVMSSHIKDVVTDYKKLLPEAEVDNPAIAVSSNKQDQLCDVISKFAGVHLLSASTNLRLLQDKKSLLQPLKLKGKTNGNSSGRKSLPLSIAEVFSRNRRQSDVEHYTYSSPISPIIIDLPKISGIYVRTIEGVSKPSGIRIDPRNSNLVVCVFGSHQLTTLNQNGTEIQKFGQAGDGSGEFLFPQNSVLDAQGKTLVVDSLYRIQVFDRNGNFLKSIGQKGKGQLQFNDPVAIAISLNKKIYVLERQNQRIQIINSNFTFHDFIGKPGKGNCEFYLPNDMTICDCQHIYVADSGNHRIQILTLEGLFLCTVGSKGSGPGELSHPSHLCVSSDEICVSEEGNNRVSVFSLKGYFLQSFGKKGTGEKEFDRPLGIAIDRNKILYVCDSKNNRIQIFK